MTAARPRTPEHRRPGYRWALRRLIATTGVLVALALTGCGEADTAAPSRPTPAPSSAAASAPPPSPTPSAAASRAIPAASGPHNDLDVMFARDMVPHHRQAVEMAELATTRAADPRVKALAARIRSAQDAEITAMASWLTAWGEQVPPPDQAHTAHGPGMMTHAEMEDLKAASGKNFDRMFCDMMIRHHQGALQMAEAATTRGQNPAVRALGAEITKTQTAEIRELKAILASL
jgi:uncharacterized protein (DUF305 family)